MEAYKLKFTTMETLKVIKAYTIQDFHTLTDSYLQNGWIVSTTSIYNYTTDSGIVSVYEAILILK
jgi:hypothetical protein